MYGTWVSIIVCINQWSLHQLLAPNVPLKHIICTYSCLSISLYPTFLSLPLSPCFSIFACSIARYVVWFKFVNELSRCEETRRQSCVTHCREIGSSQASRNSDSNIEGITLRRARWFETLKSPQSRASKTPNWSTREMNLEASDRNFSPFSPILIPLLTNFHQF